MYCYKLIKQVRFVVSILIILHLMRQTFVTTSIIVYEKRNGRSHGEMELDNRYSRNTWQPQLNRTGLGKNTYCGEKLVNIMKSICGNKFYRPLQLVMRGQQRYESSYSRQKRSPYPYDFEAMIMETEPGSDVKIVQECCRQPCSTAQLIKYCPGSSESNRKSPPPSIEAPTTSTMAPILVTPSPLLTSRKGDDGLSLKPFMLQLEDGYGARPNKVPTFVIFEPDYHKPLSRRPILTRSVSQNKIKPPFKIFQSLNSDETERDYIDRGEMPRAEYSRARAMRRDEFGRYQNQGQRDFEGTDEGVEVVENTKVPEEQPSGQNMPYLVLPIGNSDQSYYA